MAQRLDVEKAVRERYAKAAGKPEAELCCPTTYDPKLLEAIPKQVIERDYGCGDPTPHVRRGDVVLDLGAGGGKIAFIAAQVVGREGRVIGVDMNPKMLGLARKYAPVVADRLGYGNVEFRHGKIQDLTLDLDLVEKYLLKHPIDTVTGLQRFEDHVARLRREKPLVASDSIDVVVSNCVLNLVADEEKRQLFAEMFRVLKRGGRVAVSDIVSDEPVMTEMKDDPELWSGCISGAFQESEFLKAFEQAGFYGIAMATRAEQPWRTVNGIEFRSITVTAWKGKQGPCVERNQAVVYGGPWKEVRDDDNHTYFRGQPMAVCDKTFKILTNPVGPYAGQIIAVPPLVEVPLDEAVPFNCKVNAVRSPKQTKGEDYDITTEASESCCGPDGCC
ncbi:MAG: methyltransferase domain-containing protein [Planctomycetes bacterium]|nr:methyltransferase domain-containing protein [Planctomycetota bacterium]MBI3846866.1 methyltransferase domain-containing protein [Planctomycetota bacterium]